MLKHSKKFWTQTIFFLNFFFVSFSLNHSFQCFAKEQALKDPIPDSITPHLPSQEMNKKDSHPDAKSENQTDSNTTDETPSKNQTHHTTQSIKTSIDTKKIFTAGNKKNKKYIHDGLITGGNGKVDDVVIRMIRWGRDKKVNFERIVIDIENNQKDKSGLILSPPYYQLSVSPAEGRMIFTVSGNPKLNFKNHEVIELFKKSVFIKELDLLPRLEPKVWSFVMEMKKDCQVEVFELSNPVRVIIDIASKP